MVRKNIFRGLIVGLLGLAVAGLGFVVAALLNKTVGVGIIFLGMLLVVVGFIVHAKIFIDRTAAIRRNAKLGSKP